MPNQLMQIEKRLKEDCPADVPLFIKTGCEVVFVVNVDKSAGLINGARAVVVGYDTANGLVVRLIDPGADQTPIEVSPYVWTLRNSTGTLECALAAMPLRLAACMTTHKSQGLTITGKMECDISRYNIWEHGMAYTVLGRVTNSENLFITAFEKRAIIVHPAVAEFYAQLRSEKNHTQNSSDERPSSSSLLRRTRHKINEQEEEEYDSVSSPPMLIDSQPKEEDEEDVDDDDDSEDDRTFITESRMFSTRGVGDGWVRRMEKEDKKKKFKRKDAPRVKPILHNPSFKMCLGREPPSSSCGNFIKD
jgi:hypothetical protein